MSCRLSDQLCRHSFKNLLPKWPFWQTSLGKLTRLLNLARDRRSGMLLMFWCSLEKNRWFLLRANRALLTRGSWAPLLLYGADTVLSDHSRHISKGLVWKVISVFPSGFVLFPVCQQRRLRSQHQLHVYFILTEVYDRQVSEAFQIAEEGSSRPSCVFWKGK